MQTNKKLVFAFVPVLLLLLMGEVFSRTLGFSDCEAIIPDAGDWETMRGDPDLLWRLEANTEFRTNHDVTRINSVGLRETLLPTQKKRRGEKRILVTGDSSIYGWGVRDNETYAVQLERELRRRFSVPIEVINLGVPGYSTEQTLRLLEEVGWQYEPDLIIVSNLFSDCNIDAFQDSVAMRLANPQPTGLEGLVQGSRFYCACYMSWANYQANLNQNPNRVLMPGIPTGANAAVTLENLNTTLALSRVPSDDYLDNLKTIKDRAATKNALMMLAPLAQEWDVGIWNVPMPKPSAEHVLPWFPYRSAQKEWAENNNVPRVDFSKIFSEYSGPKESLFIDNMHPSVQGTRLMANAVANYIMQHPEILQISKQRR
jgi:lysophospholipase L1-like esterase